jgi:hypothetical protein
MPAQQVIEILDAIRDVHRRLAERYGELDQAATDERIQLMLEDMQQREQKFDQNIAAYESEEDPAVLETWLQFVPEEAVHIERISERLATPRTIEELVEETLRLNSTLCDAYLVLAQEAPISELRDLFMDLAKLEERNDCHYAKMLLDA